MIQIQTVFARDTTNRWHVARSTYPNAADTMCGQSKLRATFFATNPREHDLRPTYCAACAAPTVSTAAESGEGEG